MTTFVRKQEVRTPRFHTRFVLQVCTEEFQTYIDSKCEHCGLDVEEVCLVFMSFDDQTHTVNVFLATYCT